MLTVTTPDPETSERVVSQGGVTAGVPSGVTAGVPSGVTAGVPSGLTAGVPSGLTTGVTAGVASGVPCTTDADSHAACSKEHSFL